MTALVTFPVLPIKDIDFDLAHLIDEARMEGRRTESAIFGQSYWKMSAETPFLTAEQRDDARAFFEEAMLPGNYFLGHNFFNERPRAYGQTPLSGTKAVGGAFDGTGDVDNLTSSTEIDISGLPEDFEINKGCFVEVRMSTFVRSLHRVRTAVIAGTDGSATIELVNPLDTQTFTDAATVNFEKAACVMRLTGFKLPEGWFSRSVSFEAEEAFPG